MLGKIFVSATLILSIANAFAQEPPPPASNTQAGASGTAAPTSTTPKPPIKSQLLLRDQLIAGQAQTDANDQAVNKTASPEPTPEPGT